MKEKMLEYLLNNHWSSGRDHDVIKSFIEDFFEHCQPERLNPEDASNSVCDSLNSTNK